MKKFFKTKSSKLIIYFISIIMYAILYYIADRYAINVLNITTDTSYNFGDYFLFSLITATTVGAVGIKTIEFDASNPFFTFFYTCQLLTILVFFL